MKLPDWLVRFCKLFWEIRSLLWGTIILNILLGVLVTWAFTNPSALAKLPIGIVFSQPFAILTFFIVLLSFTCISGLISYLPVSPSINRLHSNYLKRILLENEKLALADLHSNKYAPSIRTDDVFIPIYFWPNQARVDQPLSERELEHSLQAVINENSPEGLERVVTRAKTNWLRTQSDKNRIEIRDLWQKLTREEPVAVIQGYPGMGKSTLLKRLASHMARLGLHQKDSLTLAHQKNARPLLPVIIRLGLYASNSPLPDINEYLEEVFKNGTMPGLSRYISQSLKSGFCLIMFDGLDEVSDANKRAEVQNAIRQFIQENRASNNKSYNKFLITSRIAGYNFSPFSGYPHYTVATLTEEQIDYFLLAWCRAYIKFEASFNFIDNNIHINLAKQQAKELSEKIKGNKNIYELAESPLLLTMLVIMHQSGVRLPDHRFELYSDITLTLLKNRYDNKRKIEPVQELTAIKLLGPLAFEMQNIDNSFAHQSDVMRSLMETMKEGGDDSDEEVREEVNEFLRRIRERGGIFVLRTDEHFGFMHRTFQEYFAARYILYQLKARHDEWMERFITLARRKDALWREPFLLAIAYEANNDPNAASKILQNLLDDPADLDVHAKERDIFLATECIIEARPSVIDAAFERKVVTQLLEKYKDAQSAWNFALCIKIEDMVCRWLLTLQEEDIRTPIVMTLLYTILDVQKLDLQRTTLTLLTMIAQRLQSCASTFFEKLIPPLVALVELPNIDGFKSASNVVASADPVVADLALSLLSFLGKQGPAGTHLRKIRQHADQRLLQQLARYSLESGTLITLAVVPLDDEKYKLYEHTVDQWSKLYEHYNASHATNKFIHRCAELHQMLLENADEACYPACLHLLDMLDATKNDIGTGWQQTWQAHLHDLLDNGSYIAYQETALLWAVLFTEQNAVEMLAKLISQHFTTGDGTQYRKARRFLAMLGNDLKYIDILGSLRYGSKEQYLKYLADLFSRREHYYFIDDLRYARDLRYLRYIGYIRNQSYLRDLRELEKILLKGTVIQTAIQNLSTTHTTAPGVDVCVDLLTILLGRFFLIRELNEMGLIIEQEILQILDAALQYVTLTNTNIVFDIIRSIPIRSENEVKIVLQCASEHNDTRVHDALASAIGCTSPNVPGLDLVRSPDVVEVLRRAAEKVFNR